MRTSRHHIIVHPLLRLAIHSHRPPKHPSPGGVEFARTEPSVALAEELASSFRRDEEIGPPERRRVILYSTGEEDGGSE